MIESQSNNLPPAPEEQERIKSEASWVDLLRQEMGRVIVGQKYLVDRLIVGLLANGHVLLEGVPGLAKTLAVKTLAQCMRAEFKAHTIHARPAPRRRGRNLDLQPKQR